MISFAATLFTALAPQEQPRPVFRVSTEAVQVDVFVGGRGRSVSGLGLADFELYDDGALRPIDHVAVAELPLNVILVLDTSESVEGEVLSQLRQAAGGFLDELTSKDRAALITFSHNTSLRSGLSSEVEPLKQALGAVEAKGGTSWQDALFCALELLEVVRDGPLVILFTDGADTSSWIREEEMIPLVSHSNAVVYAISRTEMPSALDLGSFRAQEEYRQQQREHARRVRLLLEVTRESGGRLIETESPDQLQTTFLGILKDMKTRYLLTFRPEAPVREGWHELEVKVKRKGVEVHARRGYYYESRP